METIGQRMSILMKQYGISNIDMADFLGISASYVAKFKTDARRPNTLQIDKIARKLNISTDYLLGNEGYDLKFYPNILNVENKRGINLMSGLNSVKNFAVQNEWTTISGLDKNDVLIFQNTNNNETTYNKVYLVIYNKQQAMLGRIVDNLLYFDNGLAPVDISNNEKYEIVGRLIRIERYFN